ncbi:unnamed protein product [Blepharisma stoltei]|uniref:Uncharacterized protein n=1 Tax=Blepharisma stoltei TaxID=1481888 RepID=A0AAU9JYM2_9CILI|nr:unnamed protein product [Blepharisma stoltei]
MHPLSEVWSPPKCTHGFSGLQITWVWYLALHLTSTPAQPKDLPFPVAKLYTVKSSAGYRVTVKTEPHNITMTPLNLHVYCNKNFLKKLSYPTATQHFYKKNNAFSLDEFLKKKHKTTLLLACLWPSHRDLDDYCHRSPFY